MLEPWHIWVIAGLLLWIIEIFTPGFVAGVFGTACLITAFFAWLGLSYLIQLLVFAIVTGAMTLGIRPIVLKHINKNLGMPESKSGALPLGDTPRVRTIYIPRDSRGCQGFSFFFFFLSKDCPCQSHNLGHLPRWPSRLQE